MDIYEAASKFTEIGAGIMMWGRTWKLFQELDLVKDMGKIAFEPLDGENGVHDFKFENQDTDQILAVAFDFRKSDSPDEVFQFLHFELPCMCLHTSTLDCPILMWIDGCIRFHRAHFLDVLVDRIPQDYAHFGKRLTLYREDATGVTLQFADGSTATCDILVGCDGINSTVRKEMYEQAWRNGSKIQDVLSYIDPVWSGSVTYRALVPAHLLRKEDGSYHRIMNSPMIVSASSLADLHDLTNDSPAYSIAGRAKYVSALFIGDNLLSPKTFSTS